MTITCNGTLFNEGQNWTQRQLNVTFCHCYLLIRLRNCLWHMWGLSPLSAPLCWCPNSSGELQKKKRSNIKTIDCLSQLHPPVETPQPQTLTSNKTAKPDDDFLSGCFASQRIMKNGFLKSSSSSFFSMRFQHDKSTLSSFTVFYITKDYSQRNVASNQNKPL